MLLCYLECKVPIINGSTQNFPALRRRTKHKKQEQRSEQLCHLQHLPRILLTAMTNVYVCISGESLSHRAMLRVFTSTSRQYCSRLLLNLGFLGPGPELVPGGFLTKMIGLKQFEISCGQIGGGGGGGPGPWR
jgi:hypothetical protein